MCVPIPLTDVMSLLLQIEHVIGHVCHSLIYVFTMLSYNHPWVRCVLDCHSTLCSMLAQTQSMLQGHALIGHVVSGGTH